jgi:hypothetical protein
MLVLYIHMRKAIAVILVLALAGMYVSALEVLNDPGTKVQLTAEEIYDSLGITTPAFEVFDKAYKGYVDLCNRSLVTRQVLTIIDYTLSSNEKRMWVIDIDRMKVVHHEWVAHGKMSGNEYALKFSNTPGSNMSCTGFFATAGTYNGKHGLSLYLDGLERGINDNARSRAIVIHGADYVSEDFIMAYKRLGRSLGCPALPLYSCKQIIETIRDGSCVYIHRPKTVI